LEGEALWGKPMRDKTNEMKQCARNLQVSIDAFIHNKAEDGESFYLILKIFWYSGLVGVIFDELIEDFSFQIY